MGRYSFFFPPILLRLRAKLPPVNRAMTIAINLKKIRVSGSIMIAPVPVPVLGGSGLQAGFVVPSAVVHGGAGAGFLVGVAVGDGGTAVAVAVAVLVAGVVGVVVGGIVEVGVAVDGDVGVAVAVLVGVGVAQMLLH